MKFQNVKIVKSEKSMETSMETSIEKEYKYCECYKCKEEIINRYKSKFININPDWKCPLCNSSDPENCSGVENIGQKIDIILTRALKIHLDLKKIQTRLGKIK